MGKYEAYEELLREKKRLHGKLKRRLRHLYRNLASHLVKELHEKGVSTIILRLPFRHSSGEGQ